LVAKCLKPLLDNKYTHFNSAFIVQSFPSLAISQNRAASLKEIPEGLNPVLSLSENNNRSKVLKLLLSQALSLYFLTVNQIYSSNLEIKAPKGFQ
jgi:hypothetical protein